MFETVGNINTESADGAMRHNAGNFTVTELTHSSRLNLCFRKSLLRRTQVILEKSRDVESHPISEKRAPRALG